MKHNALKTSLLLLCGSMLCSATQAQNSLYVHKKDGTEQQYALSGIRKLTFPVGSMVITPASGSATVYSITDIGYFDIKSGNVTGLQITNATAIKVNVYPNPTVQKLNIESEEEIQQLSLYDLQGRIMLQVTPMNTSATLPMTRYANGIYTLHIVTAKGTSIRKIIKTN